MNLDERREQSSTYSSMRTAMDMGMGAIYIILAVWVIYFRQFGSIDLSGTATWAFGGLLILYGGFRIVRSILVILKKSKSRQSSRFD